MPKKESIKGSVVHNTITSYNFKINCINTLLTNNC